MSLLNITASALKQFRKIIKKNNSKAIQLSLRSGGCNGFEYDIRPTTKKLGKNEELHSENGVDIHICKASLMYLIGTEISWSTDLMGNTFTFNNPKAGASCGCGTSFTPKPSEEKKDKVIKRMEERKRW
jgi:iron-sulfur cluster assembly protein